MTQRLREGGREGTLVAQSSKRKRAVAPKKAKELDLSTYSNRIAARFLQLRNERGWSREQLWQALSENGVHVSVHTIEAWETGARDIGSDHFPAIAKTFGKSVRSFLPAE